MHQNKMHCLLERPSKGGATQLRPAAGVRNDAVQPTCKPYTRSRSREIDATFAPVTARCIHLATVPNGQTETGFVMLSRALLAAREAGRLAGTSETMSGASSEHSPNKMQPTPMLKPHRPPLLPAAQCRRGCLTPEASGCSTCQKKSACR